MNQAVKSPSKLAGEPYPEAVGAISRARPAADSPKSLLTRARILDAAMRLFVDIGYHAATNARIAEAAGLTRGAMLYHFPDRDSLVEAVAPYIQAARMKMLQATVDAAPNGIDRIDHAIESYWKLLGEPPFVAFAELEGAARTDEVLRRRIAPAEAAFDRAEPGDHLFDLVQGAEGPRFQASRDLARFMLEGLARARLHYDAEGRTQRLLAVVKRAAHVLNRKNVDQDLWPEG